MSEEKNVSNEAVADVEAKEITQKVAPNEYVAESKKYRKRAQEAEARLSKLEKQIATQEEEKLKQKEDFKTLYEKVSSDNEMLLKDADRWKNYETDKRTSLLERHPEDERENLSKLDLETLSYVTNKIQKPANSEMVGRAKVSTPPTNKPWKEMNEQERRDYYAYKATQQK